MYRIIGDNNKKIHVEISFLFFPKIKKAGLVKKDMHKILKAYIPIKDVTCIISRLLEKLYAIKFHGKPVKMVPLKNSVTPNKSENKNKLLISFLVSIKKKQYVAAP
tara:strand:+ start:703 stop:1020 length:318 start_codon:yes stop_codon:yes gene_type:complete